MSKHAKNLNLNSTDTFVKPFTWKYELMRADPPLPCCRWNSSSNSVAVILDEVGLARMDAVRGCVLVFRPPAIEPVLELVPDVQWIDSALLLRPVLLSKPSSRSPPPSVQG